MSREQTNSEFAQKDSRSIIESSLQSLLKRPKRCLQNNFVESNRQAVSDSKVKQQTSGGHGNKTKPSDSVQELLSKQDNFLADWKANRFGATAQLQQRPSQKRNGAPCGTEVAVCNRTVLLRWQLASDNLNDIKTNRKNAGKLAAVQPKLDTFRSERQRQAARQVWLGERSHRLGVTGLGICAPSKR